MLTSGTGGILQLARTRSFGRPKWRGQFVWVLPVLLILGQTASAQNSIQHVSSTGNDSKDGASWGTAKASIRAACASLPGGNTNCSAGNGQILVSSSTVGGNLTLAPGIGLSVMAGGTIRMQSGETLMLNGPFSAPPQTVFVGSGTAVVKQATVKAIWWSGTIDQQINACVASVIANLSGTCDATDLRSGAITHQINVGNESGASVRLLLPTSGIWDVAITDGTSCGIRQFAKTEIVGSDVARAQLMRLQPANSSTNVQALYCTDPSPNGGGSYMSAKGFGVSNTVGATMTLGAAVFQHLYDHSYFSDITATNSNGIAVKIYDICCGTVFDRIGGNGSLGPGARPVVIGDSNLGGPVSNGGVLGTVFNGLHANLAGPGNHEVEIEGGAFTQSDAFSALGIERGRSSDLRTSGMFIGPSVHNLVINAMDFSNMPPGTTAFAIEFAPWSGPSESVVLGAKSQSNNIIKDNIHSVNVVGPNASYGQGPPYFTEGMVSGLSGSVAGSTTPVAATSCGDPVTLKINGVTPAMALVVTPNGAPQAGLRPYAFVSGPNTVTVEYCNDTGNLMRPNPQILQVRAID